MSENTARGDVEASPSFPIRPLSAGAANPGKRGQVKLDGVRRGKNLLILLILTLFSVTSAVRHLRSPGGDLASSFFGCRLLATGQADHLYSRNPRDYILIDDPVWDRLWQLDGSQGEKHVQPYVQTPLWAYILRPLCTHFNFAVFNGIFLFLISFCFSAAIWLCAYVWTPRLCSPGWIFLIYCALYLSEPYKYAMLLTQTHILFLTMTLAGVFYARKNRSVLAGLLLAAAAAVKITPGFLLLYWLVDRRKRASAVFIGVSIVLAAVGVAATGISLNLVYLHNLSSISRILLVSWNNQSFAASWMGSHFAANEKGAWHSFALPAALKLFSLLACAAAAIGGGLLDRRSGGPVPYGAAFALLGLTMFTPIAWNHYYVLLIVPSMMLLDAYLRNRSVPLLLVILLIFALNIDTATLGGVLLRFRLFPIVRSEFYSGLLSMAALAWVSLQQRVDKAVGSGQPEWEEQQHPVPRSV